MPSLDPVRHVVLLEEIADGGTPVALDGDVVAVARDPRGIRLADVPMDRVDELVARLLEVAPESVGVEGEGESAATFAAAWAVAVGKQVHERQGIRLYRLGQLRPPALVGLTRPATSADEEVCADWLASWAREELRVAGDTRWVTRRQIEDGRLWVLEADGGPVAMAGYRAPLHGVVRIVRVYTPPESRRRGYGSALTARVAGVLQQNAEVCLRTDLGNESAHGVYERIGFELVCDLRRFRVSAG